MAAKRRKRRNLPEIRSLINELTSTNLTVARLAQREGVSVGTVYLWKRKVKDSGKPVESPTPVEVIAPPHLWQPATSVSASGVRLTLPGNIDCNLEPGFDSDTLTRVIEVIRDSDL